MTKKIIITLFIILSSIWAILAFWVHALIPAICVWLLGMMMVIFNLYKPIGFKAKNTLILYVLMFGLVLSWFFHLSPSNNRNWNKEVAYNVDFKQNGDDISVYNVRNFHWRGENDYDEKWETRHYQLSQLDSVDLILSTWGIDEIAHTLLTFHFSDGQRLAFSIETRKEQHEKFSSLDGFFRQYELSFIASDEQDVIFTRTNIRTDETTYIYPLKLSKTSAQKLFLSYLQRGKQLQTQAKWYNSLTANCTTVIYDMVKQIEPTPFDYRIIASGLLPEYLYQHQILDNKYTLDEWKKMAYIQPKTKDFPHWQNQSSENFSQIIRKDLPK